MRDRFDRDINYMRISVTDRCNLRCRYCMPDGIEQVPHGDILRYEEILRIAQAAVQAGITRFKVTGGEPLARPGVSDLVRMLKEIPGTEQVTLTTNGVLLARALPALTQAGLDAVNISLDTTDRERFREITGFDALEEVLTSIDAALETAMRVKLNVVPLAGVNEEDWLPLVRLARDRTLDVRFIEMMPIGCGRGFTPVSNVDVFEKIRAVFPDPEEDVTIHGNGPARYIRIAGFKGSIGFISAIHGKFCSSCNRIRLTATGALKPCLCYGDSVDVREILRSMPRDAADRALRDALREAVLSKPRAHRFEDTRFITEQKRMVSIGG
ncbi:MAG: GTP 3',8-cyclase MoaA [Lachnospiraceae bacterium]|nr:GTP 3',8-cyclase MoaA [Lachnospiraceae bacterium]